MRTLVLLAFVTSIVACKQEPKAKAPVANAAPKSAEPAAQKAEPAASGLPGPCVALPTGEDLDDSQDFDGDGVKDLVGPPVVLDQCNKYDCQRKVFIKRGACGHYVGDVSVGYSATLTIEPGRSHGLANLKSDGLGGTLAYAFDGAKYVEKRIGEVPPPKQVD